MISTVILTHPDLISYTLCVINPDVLQWFYGKYNKILYLQSVILFVTLYFDDDVTRLGDLTVTCTYFYLIDSYLSKHTHEGSHTVADYS